MKLKNLVRETVIKFINEQTRIIENEVNKIQSSNLWGELGSDEQNHFDQLFESIFLKLVL